MNAIKFLIAAYVATWLIHVVYISTIISRFSKLRQQQKELDRGK